MNRVRRPTRAAALLFGLAVLAAGTLGAVARAQERPDSADLYDDGARVDSLRAAFGPDRLAELRHEAAAGDRPRDWYDLGVALLLSGDWEGAAEPLERVAASADAQLEESATYNLGVARGLGARPEASGGASGARADAARAGLTRAREAFRRVLRADPDAEDARWNLEVVNRWLAKLGGGGGPSGAGGGQQGAQGERREMTPEEVQRLLRAAASEERRVQEERFQRSRARDPVAERNW